MDIMELRTRLEEAPRIPPTPFMPMDGLRARLSAQGIECPRLWIKREDMTPLGAGGNKIRKLEHVLAKARAEGADVLLNTGEVQSNQVVQTAASAAHLGIPCELFLGRTDPPLSEDDQETGNILLCRILGAQVHLVPPGADRDAAMRRRAEKLRAEGRHPYIIPRGSSTAEGALGSLRCFFELLASQRLHAERHCRHRGQFGHHGGVPRRCARPCPFGRAGHPPLRLRHLRHGLPGAGP